MSGISSGIGLFSGIDSASLIQQLMAIESRPKILAQRRVAQLQSQQAAYLDINSRLSGLQTSASGFRTDKTFSTMRASSSDSLTLTANASTSAQPGSYTFLVDRLVTTQQVLSKGFADASTSGLGATGITFESAAARLDRDTALADLNGGAGVKRGKIVIAETAGGSATVDLSKAATAGEVLAAINGTSGISVTASVQDGKFVVTQKDGKNISITSATGYDTAASLGIERASASSSSVTGSSIYTVSSTMALATLNDGNGVFIGNQAGSGAYDFQVVVNDGGTETSVNVNLGNVYDSDQKVTESAVTTVGGALKRINDALTAAGVTNVAASVKSDGSGVRLVDSTGLRQIKVVQNSSTGGTTVRDLGFTSDSYALGSLDGGRVLAGLNSTLGTLLNGGTGLASGTVNITGRDGGSYAVSFDAGASLDAILREFSSDTGGKITAALNSKGTGVLITDTTGGTGSLAISGAGASALGIETAGVAASTYEGSNLQHQYITLATSLASMNGGKGIGTGRFRITDSTGAAAEVTVGEDAKSLSDIVKNINSRGLRAKARINEQGDGLEIYEEIPGGQSAGTVKMKVEDVSGSAAKGLNIVGEAPGVGTANVVDGSLERTVTIAATDTLTQIASKINAAGAGVSAAVINDGVGGTPYRLSLTSTTTGTAGRFVMDSGSFDLGVTTLEAGRDARVFFGSSDPAAGVLLSSSSNTLDKVITGVTMDLVSPSDSPVTLSISRDNEAIEATVEKFIDSFNSVVDRIDLQTSYDAETQKKGVLLGDSLAIGLRSALFNTVQGEAIGLTGRYTRLTQVGVTVGQGGKLSLDSEDLRKAIEDDPQGVADLFAARDLKAKTAETVTEGVTVVNPDAKDEFNTLGVVGRIEELVKSYVNSVDGVLTSRTRSMDDQIKLQTTRIEDFDIRLASKQEILQRKFLAMEQAIGALQSQQSALSSLQKAG